MSKNRGKYNRLPFPSWVVYMIFEDEAEITALSDRKLSVYRGDAKRHLYFKEGT